MAQETPPPGAQPGSMPDWLRQKLNEEPPTDATDVPADSTLPAAYPESSDAIPDWFAALEHDTAATPGAVPGSIPPPPGKPAAPDLSVLFARPPADDNPSLALPAQSVRTMRDRADDPRPIPTPESDLPEWMREMAPQETVSQPVTPAQLAPKVVKPVPPPAPTPVAPVRSETSTGTLLGGEISSADIDALINLPMDSYASGESASETPETFSEQDLAVLYGDQPANVTYAEPEAPPSPAPPPAYDYGLSTTSAPSKLSAEELLTLDDEALDRLLGPMEPATSAPNPTSRMKSAAATAVPLSAGALSQTTTRQDLLNPDRPAMQAEDLPDFVAVLRPADAPVQLSVGGQTLDMAETPATELDPALQQLRERSRAAQQFRPSPRSSVGALADIEGTLMAEPVLIRAVVNATTTPRISTANAIPTVNQLRHVDVLKRLLDVEEAAYASANESGTRLRRRLRVDGERVIVTVLLLAALLVPFFTDKLNLAPLPAVNDSSVAAFKTLDALGQGQPVLIAFEYGPTATGELDDLAVDLLHEVVSHGARPIIVSTDGAGLLHAEALINAFAHDPTALAALNRTATTPLVVRTDYTVLRYLPAGAVGVRALADAIYHSGSLAGNLFLAADAQGQPIATFTGDQLTALQTAPVIVLAETSDAVRAWVEQYRPPGDVSAVPPTLLLATTAAAAITAQTYSAASPTRIVGPLIGLRDAIAYRALHSATNSTAPVSGVPGNTATIGSPVVATAAVLDQRWQSVSLAALVSAVLIALGALLGGLTRLRQRRRITRLGRV